MMSTPLHVNKKRPAVFSWSGGKDSAFALQLVLEQGIYEVKYLLSTFNGHVHRLSMHGVRESLIDRQAAAIGLPLLKVQVYEASNAEYEQQMGTMFRQLKTEGIETVIYGDIFLEDLRLYREANMQQFGLQCYFPLWQQNTGDLVKSFISKGFKTITCCTNDAFLNDQFVGEIIDDRFLARLPAGVDPCGENGEFHSFCFDGPLFKQRIDFLIGEKTYQPLVLNMAAEAGRPVTKGFWFVDLIDR